MPIDILFLISLGYGFWQGFNQGVISTLFNVGAYVFGITLAFKMTPTTTNVMQSVFHSSNPSMFLGAFVINILFVMLIMRMAAKSLEKMFQMAYIGMVNQALGAVVLGFFYVLVCSIVVWFMVKARFINEQTIADSKTYVLLEPLPGKAYDVAMSLKPFAEEAWGASMNWMDRLEKYGEDNTKKSGGTDAKIYKPDASKTIEKEPVSGEPPRSYPQEDSDGIEE
ncbi:MAG: CvpA family protein [Saprospiraceae bacterium]|nr:CvpA family protein [Saprospiraceae bacterium]